MVTVKYLGRLGNQMFEYAIGRFIAEEKGYQLMANPLPFPETKVLIEGQSYLNDPEKWEGHYLDLEGILQSKIHHEILLCGYFQQSRLYLQNMPNIRKWFVYPSWKSSCTETANVTCSDILVYIRLGDYAQGRFALNHSFYDAAIELANPRKVYIASDEPNHPFLNKYRRNDSVIFTNGDLLSDLLFAQSFEKIIISCSSFSWWAAMLSTTAKEIYFPIGRHAMWSDCNKENISPTSCDLRVDDPRFTYFYNCPTFGASTSTYKPLRNVNPGLMRFHPCSRAFWFE